MSPRWLCPRVPHSLPIERFLPFSSPTQTSVPLRLRAILSHLVEAITATWTTACHWRLQMRRSCRARLTTPPTCSLRSPAHPAQAWTPIFSASCLMLWKSWVWIGLLQRNRPVAAWMNGSCRGTVRPMVNKLHHSSQRSMTRSPDLGVPYSSSPQLTALKKKGMTACLPGISQWPPISVRPPPLAGR